MTDESLDFIDGESATEMETDDGVSLGAPSLRAALAPLSVSTSIS